MSVRTLLHGRKFLVGRIQIYIPRFRVRLPVIQSTLRGVRPWPMCHQNARTFVLVDG